MQTKPGDDEHPRARSIMLLTAACFVLVGGIDLLLSEWLSGVFFLFGAFFFLKGRDIGRWPKAARVLILLAFAALAVAMFVSLIIKFKARA
jgi:hypothetical protein